MQDLWWLFTEPGVAAAVTSMLMRVQPWRFYISIAAVVLCTIGFTLTLVKML